MHWRRVSKVSLSKQKNRTCTFFAMVHMKQELPNDSVKHFAENKVPILSAQKQNIANEGDKDFYR